MADPLQTLRHHVTGAIERGEAVAIEGKPMTNKSVIIAALRKWIAQRPGLEFGNYVAWHDSITAEMILDAADNGGRLTMVTDGDKVTIDYVTGQYWSTEYRRAVCALMVRVIWAWLRENGNYKTGDDIRKAARRELGASIARRWFK